MNWIDALVRDGLAVCRRITIWKIVGRNIDELDHLDAALYAFNLGWRPGMTVEPHALVKIRFEIYETDPKIPRDEAGNVIT